jgi:hypothetical protein
MYSLPQASDDGLFLYLPLNTGEDVTTPMYDNRPLFACNNK